MCFILYLYTYTYISNMSLTTFSDRFIYASSSLTKPIVDAFTTNQEFTDNIPNFGEYVELVQTHSVLLKRFEYKVIYNMCVNESDPRIALILAAARKLDNTALFPNMEIIKEIMFGPTSTNLTIFDKDEYNIFVDGIRRVSAAITAAKLINQLAQIPEQFKHGEALLKSALADLDRLIKLNSISTITASGIAVEKDPTYAASIYFDNANFLLGSTETLVCEVYLPSLPVGDLILPTIWVPVMNLTNGSFSTADVVATVSDGINSITLTQVVANILAAPILGNTLNNHQIKFEARNKSATLAAELVSIRFKYLDSTNTDNLSIKPLPFKWGVIETNLTTNKVQSVLLAIQNGKITSTAASLSTANYVPIVLYIKRAPLNSLNEPLDANGLVINQSTYTLGSKLDLRVSTKVDEIQSIDVPYIVDPLGNTVTQALLDKKRPAQVADLIINALFNIKSDTRTLGTLYRSDDTGTELISAIELIAFTATNPETWSLLDVLKIPSDILIATGNLTTPITPFSNNPRAIRVATKFVSSSILGSTQVKPNSAESSTISFVSYGNKNAELTRIKDRVNSHRFL